MAALAAGSAWVSPGTRKGGAAERAGGSAGGGAMRHVYRSYETRDNLLAPAPSLGICASASQGLGRGGADERGVGGGSREGADGPSVTCHQSAFSDNDAGAGAEVQCPQGAGARAPRGRGVRREGCQRLGKGARGTKGASGTQEGLGFKVIENTPPRPLEAAAGVFSW